MKLSKDQLIEYFVIFFWFSLAITTALLSGPRYNPDASAYYTTALRVSQGDFWRSVDGVYGPLLSWLIAPGILFGLQLEQSFRVVNIGAFLIFLINSKTLFKLANLSLTQRLIALTVLGSQGFFLSIAIISSDMLVAASCVCFFILLQKQELPYLAGFIAAIAYLAKAAVLPILSLLMLITFLKERVNRASFLRSWALKSFIVGLLACSPWIITISIKYGEPVFSAQSLIARGRIATPFYSGTGNIMAFVTPDHLQPDSNYNRSQSSISNKFSAILSAIKYLWQTSVPLFFGQEAFILFLLLAFIGSLTAFSRAPNLLVAITIYCGFYLWFLGRYQRYYLPIMPLALILAMFGWSRISGYLPRTLKGAFSIILVAWAFSIGITNIRVCLAEPESQNDIYVSAMATLPIIRQHTGVIVGDPSTPLPPLLAAHTKREYWQDLNPNDQYTTDSIRQILTIWDCEQLIWFKERDSRLVALDVFSESGPFKIGPYSFYVYTRIPK